MLAGRATLASASHRDSRRATCLAVSGAWIDNRSDDIKAKVQQRFHLVRHAIQLADPSQVDDLLKAIGELTAGPVLIVVDTLQNRLESFVLRRLLLSRLLLASSLT